MATSDVEIGNMALAHLASGIAMTTLMDRTAEARAVSRFFKQVRDEVLGAFPWPFASRRVTLEVVESDPNDDWAFSYRYPTGALTIWRIPSGFDRAQGLTPDPLCWPVYPFGVTHPVPFVITSDRTGKLIYCDLESAEAEVTFQITDVTQFPADFTAAFALKLAGDIAPLVTQGDQFQLGARALQRYQQAISQARVRAANEARRDRTIGGESDLLMSRY